MSAVTRRLAVSLPKILLRNNCQLPIRIDLPRQTFTTLTARSLRLCPPLRSDVRGSWRGNHGKGETSQDLFFIMLRYSRQFWDKMFGKYLLITNVLSSGVLMVVGDVIAQELEYRHGVRRENRYDYDRMYRMFVAGALQGPLHHYVYKWMDNVLPHRTGRSIFKKILIDQLFMSPACIIIFFYSICYLERQTVEETNRELLAKFPYIYLMDWLTWPAAQYVNFRYLDAKYRVSFVNVCTAVYNVLMSYMKHDFGVNLPMEASNSTENASNPAQTNHVQNK